MTLSSYSPTPDSAFIQPNPQDFEIVEREFGPCLSTHQKKKRLIGIGSHRLQRF